jgi:glucan phosphoethanolaminetransferase (alkaline phosphatase superfamily)
MIQRVQSIYFLVVTILMSFLLVMPYAFLELPGNQSLLFRVSNVYLVSATDIVSVYKSTFVVVLFVLITGIFSFCIIFFYNHRILQIRLTLLNLLLIVVLAALMLYYCVDARSDFEGSKLLLKLSMVFPVLGLVFSFLAIRGIRHDEMLVDSYNRIR